MVMLSDAERDLGGPIQVPPSPPPTDPLVGVDDPNPTIIPDPVGVVDPTPTPIPGGTQQVADDYVPPNAGTPPPSMPPADLGSGSLSDGTTVQDLYPDGGEIGEVVGADAGSIVDPIGADVTETDASSTEFDASQTALTQEQQVDAELARILGQDSPLLAQARATAAQQANARGLQNTSMAVGMTQAEMVKAALPMAQQNAAQGLQREMSNTEFRQQADELQAQMRTALEQQDTAAYNRASEQLAALTRDANAQQGELDYRASQAEADAINQRNTQTIDSVTRLNQQYLQNMGAADLATIEGTYKQLIASNQAASGIYNSMLTAMAQLMSDPKMTPQQVSSGLATMQRSLEASMRMLSNINDMDFEAGAPAPAGGGGPGGGGGGARFDDAGTPIAE